MKRYALRPLEAFNLAAIHSWGEFYLHDDFYNPQTGEAYQPGRRFFPCVSKGIPHWSSVGGDADRLLDYHAAGSDAAFTMPASIDDATLWKAITTRLDRFPTQHVKRSILILLAQRAVPAADKWLVNVWRELFIAYWDDWTMALMTRFGERQAFDLLNRAIEDRPWPDKARDVFPLHWGLPSGLAFRWIRSGNRSDAAIDQVTRLLDRLDERARTNQVMGATDFRSARFLPWIERSCPDNPGYEWSTLAVCSRLDWPTVRRWLGASLPLCRLALRALLDCRSAEMDKDKRSGVFADFNPSLIDPPSVDDYRQQLEQARARYSDDATISERVDKALASFASIVDARRHPDVLPIDNW